MYRLFLTAEFDKTLSKIAPADRRVIEKKISEYMAPQIKAEPHHGTNIKKLKGYNPETWRYRIGRYRLFYLINESDQIISMLSIDQRKDAY
jgi:mRNA interferase RelE/StbE